MMSEVQGIIAKKIDDVVFFIYNQSMICKNPCIDFFEMCGICMESLENTAMKSALDMGIPDYFYCGCCGTKLTPEQMAEHIAQNSKCECASWDYDADI